MHLKALGRKEHNPDGSWKVVFHREFARDFAQWADGVQDALLSQLIKVRIFGPSLGRPSVDTLKGSSFANMKELRINAEGGVWRVAFAFDPDRRAILLVGGDKSGVSKERFYSTLIRIADARYGDHLRHIAEDRQR